MTYKISNAICFHPCFPVFGLTFLYAWWMFSCSGNLCYFNNAYYKHYIIITRPQPLNSICFNANNNTFNDQKGYGIRHKKEIHTI